MRYAKHAVFNLKNRGKYCFLFVFHVHDDDDDDDEKGIIHCNMLNMQLLGFVKTQGN